MTLLHRAYSLTSNYKNFTKEVDFLCNFFKTNGFNDSIFFKQVRRFLNNKYAEKLTKAGPQKQKLYIKFPYISKYMNYILNDEIKSIMSKHLPQINLHLAIYNNYKIGSFFQIKEKLPNHLCSSIVYKFTCSKCSLEYIGSSIRNLTLRVDEHRGYSTRTSSQLVRPLHSTIRDHCHNICDYNFSIENFNILSKASNVKELRIIESIFIRLKKPALNIDSAAYPLYIF